MMTTIKSKQITSKTLPKGTQEVGSKVDKKIEAVKSPKQQIQSVQELKPVAKTLTALTQSLYTQQVTKESTFGAESSVTFLQQQVSSKKDLVNESIKKTDSKEPLFEVVDKTIQKSPIETTNKVQFVQHTVPTSIMPVNENKSENKSEEVVRSSSMDAPTIIEISAVPKERETIEVYPTFSAMPKEPVSIMINGIDVYNLDTVATDLRSYSGELLSSFDQLTESPSSVYECEIISLIYDSKNKKVIIPFRMGDYDSFMIKITDMFFDRKVFFNGLIVVEDADEFLQTSFYEGISRMEKSTDTLVFNRTDSKKCIERNKDALVKNGVNVSFNYQIFGAEDDVKKAKRITELGCFDYSYNSTIQSDAIYIHKIYGIKFSLPDVSVSTATIPVTTVGDISSGKEVSAMPTIPVATIDSDIRLMGT